MNKIFESMYKLFSKEKNDFSSKQISINEY